MDYQLEIKQIVDYPRCRIYREFFRTLMANRDIRTSGSSYISLFKDSGHRVDCIFPVMEEKRPVGAVLLLRCHSVQPSEQLCAGFLAEILSEQLKNQ